MFNFQTFPKLQQFTLVKPQTFNGLPQLQLGVKLTLSMDYSRLVFQMARSCSTQTIQKFLQPIHKLLLQIAIGFHVPKVKSPFTPLVNHQPEPSQLWIPRVFVFPFSYSFLQFYTSTASKQMTQASQLLCLHLFVNILIPRNLFLTPNYPNPLYVQNAFRKIKLPDSQLFFREGNTSFILR